MPLWDDSWKDGDTDCERRFWQVKPPRSSLTAPRVFSNPNPNPTREHGYIVRGFGSSVTAITNISGSVGEAALTEGVSLRQSRRCRLSLWFNETQKVSGWEVSFKF